MIRERISGALAADELGLAAEAGAQMRAHLNAAAGRLGEPERGAALRLRGDLDDVLRRLRPLRIFVGDDA